MVFLKWFINQVLIVLGPLLVDRLMAWNQKRVDAENEKKARDAKIDQEIEKYDKTLEAPETDAAKREKAFEDLINRPK